MPPERFDRLPSHPVPRGVRRRREWTIRVEGIVARPLTLTQADLAGLPRQQIEGDFSCEEGWEVAGLRWKGIRLADVLALADPLPAAAYVRVLSGVYAVPIAVADAASALLCEELDGERIETEQGGPWRLLLPGRACFTSVKWVDRLELASEPGEASGEQIARARQARTPGRAMAGGLERIEGDELPQPRHRGAHRRTVPGQPPDRLPSRNCW